MKRLFKRAVTAALGVAVALTATIAPVSAAWSKTSSGQWIYTTESGSRATGWQKVGGTWYYLGQDGVMRTGWQQIDSTWYYLSASGVMRTGWQKIDGYWYFFNGGGAMKKGWLQNGGKWYYLNGNGAMRTGWLKSGDSWYFLDSAGAMIMGWYNISGKTYYFTESGQMVTGEVTIGGISYPFDSSGAYIGDKLPGEEIADQILQQVNSVRAKEGLAELKLSNSLSAAADKRASERAQMGSIAHLRPDGSQWWTVLEEYGVSNLEGSAENLAYGMDTPDAAMKAWMESSTHKSAILGDQYRYMGVGRYTKDGVTYWAQLFSGSETAK